MTLEILNPAKNSFKDRAVYYGHRVWNFSRMAKLGMHANPLKVLLDYKKRPWVRRLLNANHLHDMVTMTRTGPYKKASAAMLSGLVDGISAMLEDMYNRPDRVILHEDLVPPEILYGMDLVPWMAEFLGIAVPMIDPCFAEPYIDIAENHGIVPDVCSLPKTTIGLCLDGQMPEPVGIIASNMPCDGGMSQYMIMEKVFNREAFRLDVPYNFYNERAVSYFADELKRMIAWLEENTPGKMDWDRMKMICEERNKASEYELELWDLLREKPSPMAGEAVSSGTPHVHDSPAGPAKKH